MDTAQILQLVQLVVPVIGPLLTEIFKAIWPAAPKQLLPVFAAAAGTVTASLAGADIGHAATLGLAGIGVREIYDQVQQVKNGKNRPATV